MRGQSLFVCMVLAGCVGEPVGEPASSSMSSPICALDEDGHWVGDTCGPGPGGGGGGGDPNPLTCAPMCDPTGGISADINCSLWCVSIMKCNRLCQEGEHNCEYYEHIGICG